MPSQHARVTSRLLAETAGVQLALAVLTLHAPAWLVPLCVVASGIWLDRVYVVAHESSHMKLIPGVRPLNDALGTLLLWPLVTPLAIFRKIHAFHHGHNRRDERTSALDVFVVDGAPSRAKRIRLGATWILCVFGGGFFLHSLATILIFLLVPERLAVRISPAFKGWPPRRRLAAFGELGLQLLPHVAIWNVLGRDAWVLLCGAPLLVFAWVWSLLLYIYHYDTSIGANVGYNVRALRAHPVLSWLLLNFNEHVTHHSNPKLPWYELPAHRVELPAGFRDNQKVETVWQAVLHQLRGPRIVVRAKEGA